MGSNILKCKAKFLAAVFILITTAVSAAAQTLVSTITPPANDISAEIPPLPGRLSAFGWQGVDGTDYEITFKTSAAPALVVGVGAQVLSTVFDSSKGELTVSVAYDGLAILVDTVVPLPEKSFLIVIDPGISSNGLSASGCYGPGNNPDQFKDDRGDFGDDDGLVDPSPPEDDDGTVGISSSQPGSFFSTRSFYWCVVPPTAAQPSVGFRVSAAPSTQDALSFTISSSLVDFIAGTAGLTGSTSNQFAVGSAGAQVSVNVFDTDEEGISFSGNPRFVAGETTVDIPFTNAMTSPAAKILVTRDVTLIKREAVSFAPETIKPTKADFSVSGFVADPNAVGEPIEIVRYQNRKCTSESKNVFGSQVSSAEVGVNAVGGVVIGRDVVKANGSYTAKIPTSSAFPNNKMKATLGSRIISGAVQESRQINLNRNIRDNRR